jgi:calcineurin-like phosphoesterase family protein
MNKTKIFFTSDTHFSHTNCIKYDNRPFKDADEMNNVMIDNWNKKVPKDGIVFHNGDLGMQPLDVLVDILYSLNGKIFLIKGNHDKNLISPNSENPLKIKLIERFEWIKDYYELWVQDSNLESKKQLFCMMHYPMACWNLSHYGQSIMLHGHSHGNFKGPGKILDVGVNSHNYTPLSYQEVLDLAAKKDAFDQVTQQIIEKDEVGEARRERVIERHNLNLCPTCKHIIKE